MKNELLEFRIDSNKELRLKFGEFIKKQRDEKGLSQDDLAKMLDINRSTISKIEIGKFAITIDYIERIASILDFELQFIQKNNCG